MKRLLFTLVFSLFQLLHAQVYINEIDLYTSDENSKVFIELISNVPDYKLDGYQLLFLKEDKSDPTKNYLYYAINLEDITTDKNGLLLIGNKSVDPYPTVTFNTKIIENTPIIIGLYKGDRKLKMYDDNPSLTFEVSVTCTTDENKLSDFYAKHSFHQFIDLRQDLSYQLNENGQFVLLPPTPGREYTNALLEETDYLMDEDFQPEEKLGKVSTNHPKTSKFYFPDGKIIEAYFPGELHTGNGKISYKNGDIYEGDIVNDEMSGIGRFTWANGDRYEGSFTKNIINGRGIMYFSDGDVYEGFFKNNQFHGKGKFIKADGTVEEGTFEEGTFEEGTFEEGTFEEGILK